jgi:hypothetical protein
MEHFFIAKNEIRDAKHLLSKEEFARLLYLNFLYPELEVYYIDRKEVANTWNSCLPYPNRIWQSPEDDKKA